MFSSESSWPSHSPYVGEPFRRSTTTSKIAPPAQAVRDDASARPDRLAERGMGRALRAAPARVGDLRREVRNGGRPLAARGSAPPGARAGLRRSRRGAAHLNAAGAGHLAVGID